MTTRPGTTERETAPVSTDDTGSTTPDRRRRIVRIGPSSWVIRPRMVAVTLLGLALTLLLFLLSVGVSDYPLSPLDVARILLGGGTRIENVVVLSDALPRALVSVLVGFALGAAGALSQLIARNPLATPDIPVSYTHLTLPTKRIV